MYKRLFGALTLALALVLTLPSGALLAVEADQDAADDGAADHGPLPGIEEVGTGSETSQQFRPEPYEPPEFLGHIAVPLLIVAVVAILAVLFLYLVWQPRFAEESRSGRRR